MSSWGTLIYHTIDLYDIGHVISGAVLCIRVELHLSRLVGIDHRTDPWYQVNTTHGGKNPANRKWVITPVIDVD